MNRLPVSVVVVSRGRPDALRRCLTGLSRLQYDAFEIIVVADEMGRTMLRRLPLLRQVHLIAFDGANISQARNLGIAAAAGEIVAFIDDDAVPEPTWLHHLTAPFAETDVAATGGYVRGRNGISFQTRAQSVDGTGQTAPIHLRDTNPVVLAPTRDKAIKTEGTNMALRRSVLAAMGGFDPRYRFFLDETDVNMRLADLGVRTAIVPLAQVHHGFAASARRRSDRVPLDLFEIGASCSVFLAAHCVPEERAAALRRVQHEQRTRLIQHLVRGGLEPRDMRRLLASLKAGFEHGLQRHPAPLPLLPKPTRCFLRFPAVTTKPPVFLAGRPWQRPMLRRRARHMAADGVNVTLILLSPTALLHRVSWRGTYWEQSGGIFGKSERSQKLFSFWRFSKRVAAEIERVGSVRVLP
ncbi:glycosyltransferase family 2 protein [Pontibaca salina]|uniref:Glycosyltransferase family 2 protein n=1 Tax=Pontibaca salina TaxID=2795731 RepID=A0A934HHW2_9RHOB|nr:glycosyltransferase family 2 protein [Pontibaca salina]MBI6628458.1 glycosyltransferase family 2 protein [Pontibaca salina]